MNSNNKRCAFPAFYCQVGRVVCIDIVAQEILKQPATIDTPSTDHAKQLVMALAIEAHNRYGADAAAFSKDGRKTLLWCSWQDGQYSNTVFG
jgi:hypothetical protein